MKKIFIVMLAAMAVLSGCAKSPETAETPNASSDTFMEYKLEPYRVPADAGKLGAAGDKAVKLVKETEFYKNAEANVSLLDEEYLDRDGNPKVELIKSYPDDYDGDGRTETFIIARVMYADTEREYIFPRSHIFALLSDGGDVTMLHDHNYFYDEDHYASIIEYKSFKHIALKSNNLYIYGVNDGKAEELAAIKGSMLRSDGCFLSVDGGHIYYSAEEGKYLIVKRRKVPIEDIKAMDKDNTLSWYYDIYDKKGHWEAVKLEDRFYVFTDTKGFKTTYEYMDGKFIKAEDSKQIKY